MNNLSYHLVPTFWFWKTISQNLNRGERGGFYCLSPLFVLLKRWFFWGLISVFLLILEKLFDRYAKELWKFEQMQKIEVFSVSEIFSVGIKSGWLLSYRQRNFELTHPLFLSYPFYIHRYSSEKSSTSASEIISGISSNSIPIEKFSISLVGVAYLDNHLMEPSL